MKNLLLILLFIPVIIYSQSQKLNGIDLNGPKGFVKTENLTWRKGNDLISVQSFEGKFTVKEYEEVCSEGSRTTEYLAMETQEISGTEYQICLQYGENGMLLAQVPIYRNGYTYIVTVGTYTLDYEESKRIEESMYQVFYMIGYMVTRVTLF
ncbi:MAG: hypothetical protein CMD36_06665 [Flavobacteriales bacterium]|nr:hypothetical protein [Flavobacteriales bacterium]|tara:strand:- start:1087 stop:1542 length:456 start_codon:yes stop_codon:yes gene_type:complete